MEVRIKKNKKEEKVHTLPPRNANVSAAIILLIEINVATNPTVQWALPPSKTGQYFPISENTKVNKYNHIELWSKNGAVLYLTNISVFRILFLC